MKRWFKKNKKTAGLVGGGVGGLLLSQTHTRREEQQPLWWNETLWSVRPTAQDSPGESQVLGSSAWVTCGGGLRELRGLGELGVWDRLAVLDVPGVQACSPHTWTGQGIHRLHDLLDPEVPGWKTVLVCVWGGVVGWRGVGCSEVVWKPGDQRRSRRDERSCAEKLERCRRRRRGEVGIDRTNMKEKSQRDS